VKLKFFTPAEWGTVATKVHAAVFGAGLPENFQRIDFAIVAEDDEKLVGYMTGVEINSELLRFGFGGCVPGFQNTLRVVKAYSMALEWAKKGPWLSAITIIKNDNLPSLKLALAHGFRVIGVQYFEGDVLLELQLKLKDVRPNAELRSA